MCCKEVLKTAYHISIRLQRCHMRPTTCRVNVFLELSYVRNAVFTDPDDQGAWYYYKWLMRYAARSNAGADEGKHLDQLLELEPNCKFALLERAKALPRAGDQKNAYLTKLANIDVRHKTYYSYLMEQ